MNPMQAYLRLAADPPFAEIDIVAVHGLNPLNKFDPGEDTWRAPESKKSWLRDFLPKQIPTARIFIFGYNSNVAFSSGNEGVYDQAHNLCAKLLGYREDAPSRPLVFISHSLGGLVVKRAMVLGRLNDQYAPIRKATYGLVFFGTPHQGGNHAGFGELAASVARGVLRNPGNDYLNALKKKSFFAAALREDFRQHQEDFHVLTFYETLPMSKVGIVVDKDSAMLGLTGQKETRIGLRADHSNICRFESQDSEAYRPVWIAIHRLVDQAIKALSIQGREAEALFPSTDLANQLSLNFIFRPQLTHDLETLLAQDAEHEQMPKTVLVHGHAGFGKTQLVRAHCRTEVRKGVLFRWFDASSAGTLSVSLVSFAQEAGLVPPDSESGYSRQGLKDSSIQRAIQKALKFIGNLTQDWLLVYDNYDVPEDGSFDLRSYFPGGQRGRIIVTSRNRGVATDIGATCLLVGSMSILEGVELFKKSAKMLNLEASSSAQALQKEIAADLLGCHPLAIAQAGAYICNKIVPRTMELEDSLSKYKKRFLAHRAEMLDGDRASLVKEYGYSVITSWDMSFRTILQQSRTAAEVLLFCGFMHHTSIPQHLFAKTYESKGKLERQDGVVIAKEPYNWLQAILVSDEDDQWDSTVLEDCLGLLESYSLIKVTKGPNYSIHPLVHNWTRLGKITSQEELEARAQLALVMLSYMYEEDYDRSPRSVAAHMKFISHLESCIRFTQEHTKLLTLSRESSNSKLRARCLLNLSRLLDGPSLSWELKARQLSTDLRYLAIINGSINNGLDDTSTMEAFVVVLGSSQLFTQCADIVGPLSQIMLNLVPVIASEGDGCTNAELHFALLVVRFISLYRSVTPGELVDLETETILWADRHRHEMSSSFYLPRKASFISLASTLTRLDHAARLPRLKLLLDEIEAELGTASSSAWLTRLAIAQCLEETGNQSEAVITFRNILENCKSSESDIRGVLKQAHNYLSQVLIRKRSFDEVLELYRSLEKKLVKELGPYHEDTLEARTHVLYYENTLLNGAYPGKFPYGLTYQAWFARKDGGLGLDAFIVLTVETAIACRALAKHDEIPSLWQGVINQARLLPRPEALFQKVAWALETAADAGDRQRYHYLALVLRTSSNTLTARIAANRAQESKVVELERLKSIWDQLAHLHEASDASDNETARKIATDIYFEVRCAPKKTQPAMVWLVIQYVVWLYQLEITTLVSPIPYRTLGHFQRLAAKYFKPDNIFVYQTMGSLALCYRLSKRAAPALWIEDFLIEKSIKEGLEQARMREEQITTKRPVAAVILERLVNEYRRRKWYPEDIRIFEIIVKSFAADLGVAAEQTMRYTRFVCELYGRLQLHEKIDELLEDLLKRLQHGAESDKRGLFKQLYSVIAWCFTTEQFTAAQRVLSWLMLKGMHTLDLSMKLESLRHLEILARKVNGEDLVKENDRLKVALQEQIAQMEQSMTDETHKTDSKV